MVSTSYVNDAAHTPGRLNKIVSEGQLLITAGVYCTAMCEARYNGIQQEETEEKTPVYPVGTVMTIKVSPGMGSKPLINVTPSMPPRLTGRVVT